MFNQLNLKNPWLIFYLFVIILLLVITIAIWSGLWHIGLTWSLIISLFFFTGFFHLVAWFFRGKITASQISAIDYASLGIAILGLLGISTLEAEIAQNYADRYIVRVDTALSFLRSDAEWARDYHEGWDEGTQMPSGYSAGELLQWFTEALVLLNKDYDATAWEDFVEENQIYFGENLPWDVENVLSGMSEYAHLDVEYNELIRTARNDWYFGARLFSFWALAISLALRVTKTTIGLKKWAV